jgi:predicted regulator of Ras-like GTPase activity (Roadblock/LC7/MglB family)
VLDETLATLLETVREARAALLVGMDGIVVAGEGRAGDLPWDLVVASYTDLLRRIGAVNREAGIGDPVEMVVTAGDTTLVLRSVTPDYGLLVALPAGGSLGRARFELRKAAGRIRPELAD